MASHSGFASADRDELELYEEHIRPHYEDPYHRGKCDHCTHCHEDTNPLCGDRVRMELRIVDGTRVREIYFDGEGCCISQAAASMLAERFDGRTVEEIKRFTAHDMLRLYGARLTPNRQKCCLLPWRVLQTAIYSPASSQLHALGHTAAGGESLPEVPAGPVDSPAPNSGQTSQARSAVAPLNRQLHPSQASDPPTPGESDRRQSTGPLPDAHGKAFEPHGQSDLAERLARCRDDFPILARVVHGDVPLAYFDNAATTQRPRQVIESMVACWENYYGNVHRGIHTLAEQSTARYEEARRKVARLLGASSVEQIVFTHGATESINLVARCWGEANLRPGDRIVVTEMEHHANLVPWHQLAARIGAVVVAARIDRAGRLDLQSLRRLLGPQTRMVAVTAVSNVLGTVNPVTEIVQLAHRAGALVLVDAAQAVPHQRIDVQRWDADFVVFSGHKMLGPDGVGILYGKRQLLQAMPPWLGGGHMIRQVRLGHYEPSRAIPDRFEAGTPPITAAIGLGAAIDYLNHVGLETIALHQQLLTRRAHEVLGAIPEVHIVGPAPEEKAGIVSFTVEGVHAHDVAQVLDRHGIAVRAGHHCAMPLHERLGVPATVRASFYLYNTLEEVDRLGPAVLAALRQFARR